MIRKISILCCAGLIILLSQGGCSQNWFFFKNGIKAGANLEGRDLSHKNLEGANLYKATLYGAKLKGTVLRNADLRHANLSDTDLTGANLEGANLEGARLCRSKLGFATFLGASLRNANLEGADWKRFVILSHAQLGCATWFDGTRCAPGSINNCEIEAAAGECD